MIETYLKEVEVNEVIQFRTYTKIQNLKKWEKNPRGVKTEDFPRLKAQLRKFGQYKPNIVTAEGIILGGNMRLEGMLDIRRAKTEEDKKFMQENPDAFSEIWVSVVFPQSEAEMIEYALSDNDRIGYYEEDKVAELVLPYQGQIQLEHYKLDLGEPIPIQDILNKFGPGDEADQPRLDQREPQFIICPDCGYEGEVNTFDKKKHEDTQA